MNRMWKPSIKIRLGGALTAVTILVFVAAAVRIVSYRGWITPVRISGGSMAPAFAGEHWQRACADCGFTFRYDAAAALSMNPEFYRKKARELRMQAKGRMGPGKASRAPAVPEGAGAEPTDELAPSGIGVE